MSKQQTAPIPKRNRGGFLRYDLGFLVPTTGLEPATPVLQVRCATNCAKSADASQLSDGRRATTNYDAGVSEGAGSVVSVGAGVGVSVA